MPTELPWDLVPPRSLLPPPASLVTSRAERLEDPRQRSAFLWTTAIIDQAAGRMDYRRLAFRAGPDFPPWMAAGFVPLPPGLEPSRSLVPRVQNGFLFGLCLLLPHGPGPGVQLLEPLRVGDLAVPVLALAVEFHRHQQLGRPPHPVGAKIGTAACWAEPTPGGPNPTALPGTGILTAAHVAIAASATTPMTPPSPYAVIGYAIDASVLYPAPRPATASPLSVRAAVAVGASVDVFPRGGASTRASILQVFQPSPYVGVLGPHRMIIDRCFAAGDSGALARDAGSGEAVGLYIGAIGATLGVCQIMQQVVTELAVDLYL